MRHNAATPLASDGDMHLQVWVKPQVREGKIYWLADSDSALTKVLFCSLLCNPAHSTAAETSTGQASENITSIFCPVWELL